MAKMANYRITSILASEDLGASGTKTIDVNLTDIISRIDLIWKATVNTVSVMTAPLIDCLSKIELVDGSDVLVSVSGEELQALNYYDRNDEPLEQLSLTASDEVTSIVSIDFGRYLYDPELALDPSKFRNLQLKVTWDEDAFNSGVTANSLSVNAHVFDKKSVTPRGFLMVKEIYSYTPAANGYEYIDLPTDYAIRKLLFRSKSTTITPTAAISEFKLSEDNDKVIPFDMTGAELYQKIASLYDRMEFKATLDDAVTAKTLYVIPTEDVYIHVNYDSTVFTTSSKFAEATVTNNKIALSASVDIKALTATYGGYCPHSTLVYPFGDQSDTADWYDVSGIGSLQLIVKGAASVGTSPEAQVILQQFRTY